MTSVTFSQSIDSWHAAFWGPITLRWARERGLSHSVIERYRLGFVTEGDYAGRVSIPYFDYFGRVIGASFRSTNGADPKYLRTEGEACLFKVRSVDADEVVLCEGELDTITAQMAGYKAVGVPGTHGFKDYWAYLFRNCDVTIAFDGDEEGKRSAGSVLKLLRGMGVTARVASIPEGKDLNDLWVEGADLGEILGR